MSDALQLKWDGRDDRLFIHFDVEDHQLNLDTFIKTAESARRIVQGLNEAFFKGELGFEIIVLPPNEASFLTNLRIQLQWGVASVFAFICTDPGAAFVEGLTDHTPSYWFKEAGHGLQLFSDVLVDITSTTDDDNHALNSDTLQHPKEYEVAAKMITSMARGVLQAEPQTLQKLQRKVGYLPEAMEARAEFYEACLNDPEIKRIGFTPEDDFPINRNSFAMRAVKPERKPKEEDEPEWLVTTESIFVTSPNWDQEDQKTRQWKGKDSIRRDCYFVIEDAEFWFRVTRKGLHVEVLDSLKVQWAYQLVGGKAKKRRVLRVLEFNGDKLAEPLAPDAISAILGSYASAEISRSGPTLFD